MNLANSKQFLKVLPVQNLRFYMGIAPRLAIAKPCICEINLCDSHKKLSWVENSPLKQALCLAQVDSVAQRPNAVGNLIGCL